MNTNMALPNTPGVGLGNLQFTWSGGSNDLSFDQAGIRKILLTFERSVYVVNDGSRIGFTTNGELCQKNGKGANLVGLLPPTSISAFGDPSFNAAYGVRAAYYAGGMANAIASEEMVIALAREGLMGSFGSGGLSPERLLKAIESITAAVPNGSFLFNLLHNPFEPEMEQKTVELYLENGIHAVEAAAYIRLTPPLVQFRAAGLSENLDGQIRVENRVIAKISRKEIALLFLQPAPQAILDGLVREGKITPRQAQLACQVPMADDIAVEADSGGHTDNRPLVSLLPSIIAFRDQVQGNEGLNQRVRVGAGGGISTPDAVLAAFMMGAAFVVTGSINQACVESGASEHTRQLLGEADMADVTMAPSADMFELGARVQVLKKGSMFAMRAQKLYDLYVTCNSIDDIPEAARKELEERIFMRSMDDIWQETVVFFSRRNPGQIEKAEQNPKKKMALIFRWYLGLSSRWSRDGVQERKMDYQIWCGPAMGAFNEWARGTYLQEPANRHVADLAWQLMKGCAYRSRVQALLLQGVHIPAEMRGFYPERVE